MIDNSYSCVDPALKELSVQDLLAMATAQGVKVTHGLAASVLLFAKDDIAKIESRARYQWFVVSFLKIESFNTL